MQREAHLVFWEDVPLGVRELAPAFSPPTAGHESGGEPPHSKNKLDQGALLGWHCHPNSLFLNGDPEEPFTMRKLLSLGLLLLPILVVGACANNNPTRSAAPNSSTTVGAQSQPRAQQDP